MAINDGDTEPLAIFRSLENAGKLSWEDVRFLKEGLSEVQRLDLMKHLTDFEIKRDFALLLDLYGKMRQRSQSFPHSSSESIVKVAEHLTILMATICKDGFDVSDIIRQLMESGKEFKRILGDLEEETERELSDPWSKLTLLVLIAGEIVAENMAKEERSGKPNAPELCFTAADKLSSRMLKLGKWDDFRDYVEERYNFVYLQKHSVSDNGSLNLKKKVAELVHQLKQSAYFL